MSEDFVGFARSPKQREGSALQLVEEVMLTKFNRKDAAAALFSREAAKLWLGECAKWELTVGSKIDITAGALAGQRLIVTEANLPKAITLVADSFGEFRATFGRQLLGTKVALRLTRWSLENEQEEFRVVAEELLFGAKKVLGGE